MASGRPLPGLSHLARGDFHRTAIRASTVRPAGLNVPVAQATSLRFLRSAALRVPVSEGQPKVAQGLFLASQYSIRVTPSGSEFRAEACISETFTRLPSR